MIGSHLLEQLNRMRQSGCLCDLELISHDKASFKVHHAVFVALNPKQFEAYMTGKIGDTSSMAVRKIVLNSVTSKELKMVVEFIYGVPVIHKSSFDLLEKSLKKLSMGHLIKETGGLTLEPEEVNVKMESKQLQEHYSPTEVTDTSQTNVPLFTVETSEGTVHVKLENTYDDETDRKCTEKLVTENNVDVNNLNKANLEHESEMDTFIENEIDAIFEKTDQMTDVVDALHTVKDRIFEYSQTGQLEKEMSNQTESRKTSSNTACEPINKDLVSGQHCERSRNMLSSNSRAKQIASLLPKGCGGTKVFDHGVGVDIKLVTTNLGDQGHVHISQSKLSDRKTEIGEREKLTVQKRKRALSKIYNRQIKSKQNTIAMKQVKTHNAPSINQQQLSFSKDSIPIIPIRTLPLPLPMVFPGSIHNQGHIPKIVQDILANHQKDLESRNELKGQMEEHLQTHQKTASNKNKYIQVNNKWYLVQYGEEKKVTHRNLRHLLTDSNTHQHDHISSREVSKRRKAESCPAESTVNGNIEIVYPLNENGNAQIWRKVSEEHTATWTEGSVSTRVSSYGKGAKKEKKNMSSGKEDKIQGTTCKHDGSPKSWVISKYIDSKVSCNEQSFLSELCNGKKAQNNTTSIDDKDNGSISNRYTNNEAKSKKETKENGNTCCFVETYVVSESAYDKHAEKHIVSKEKGNIQNQNEEIPGIQEKCNEERNEQHEKYHKDRNNTPEKFKEERNETSEKYKEERNETHEQYNEERKKPPENNNEEIYGIPETYNEENNEKPDKYNEERNKTHEKFNKARNETNEKYNEEENEIPEKNNVERNETHQEYNEKRNKIPKKLNEDTNETHEYYKESGFISESIGNGAENDSAIDKEKTKSCNEKCTSKSMYENDTKARDHMQVDSCDVEKSNLSESHNDKNKENHVGIKKEENSLFHNEGRYFSSETNNDKDAMVNEISKYEEDNDSYKEKRSSFFTEGTYKADIKTETKEIECINSQNEIITSLSDQVNDQVGEIQAISKNTEQCFNENTKPICKYSACNDTAKYEVQTDKENTFSHNGENILTCELTTCNDMYDNHNTVLRLRETILTREEEMSVSKETKAQNVDNDMKIRCKEERCLLSIPIIDLASGENIVISNDKKQSDGCIAELSNVMLAENETKEKQSANFCIAEVSCISASKIHRIGDNDKRPKEKENKNICIKEENVNICIKQENFTSGPCNCKGSEDDVLPVSKDNTNSCIDIKCLISEPAIIDKTSRNDIMLKEKEKIQHLKKENNSMLKEVGDQEFNNDTSFKRKEIVHSCTEQEEDENVNICIKQENFISDPCNCKGSEDDVLPVSKENTNSCIDIKCLISEPAIIDKTSRNDIMLKEKEKIQHHKKENNFMLKEVGDQDFNNDTSFKRKEIAHSCTEKEEEENVNICIKQENFISDPCICKGSEDDVLPVSKENTNSCIDIKCLISEPAIIDKTSKNDIMLKEKEKIQHHKKENNSMLKEVGDQDFNNDTSFKRKEIAHSCTEVSSCLTNRNGRREPGYIQRKKRKNKSKSASNKLEASDETVSDSYAMKKVSVRSKAKTSRTDFELLPLSLTSCIPSSEILTLCLHSKEQTKNTLNGIDNISLKGLLALKPNAMSNRTNTNYKEPPVNSDILKMYSPSTKCPLLLSSLNSKRQSFSYEDLSKRDEEKYSGSRPISTSNKAIEKTWISSKNIQSDGKKCSQQPENIEDTILESTVDKQIRKNNYFEQSPSPRIKDNVSGTMSELRSPDYFQSKDKRGKRKSRLPEALLDASLLSTKSAVKNCKDKIRLSFDMLGNKSTRIKKVHLDFSSSESKICPSQKIDQTNLGNVGCSYQQKKQNQARNTEVSELEDETTEFTKIKIHGTAIQEDNTRQCFVSEQPVIQNNNTGNKYPSHNFETLKRMMAQPSPASCKSTSSYSPQSNVTLVKANEKSSGILSSDNSVCKRHLDKDKKQKDSSGQKKQPKRLKATKGKTKLKEKKYFPETLKLLSGKVVKDNLCNNDDVIKRLMSQQFPSSQFTEIKPGANRTGVQTNERPLALISPRPIITRIPVVLCQGYSPNITIRPVTSRRPLLLSKVNDESPGTLSRDKIVRKRRKDKGKKRKMSSSQTELPKRLKVTKEKKKLIEKKFFPEKLKYLTEKVVNDNLCNNNDVINRLMSEQCPSDQVNKTNHISNKNVVQTNERISSSPTITRIPVVVCKGNGPNITISPVSTRRPLKLIAPKPETPLVNEKCDPINETDLSTSDITDITNNFRKRLKSFESKDDDREVRCLKKSKSSAQILLKHSFNTGDEGTNESKVINEKINSSEVDLQLHSERETSHGKVTSDEESIPLSVLALKLASKPYQNS